MDLGQTIKRLRKERGFTQEELAERLNVTPQAVSKWENGVASPDISQVVPLASVFDVSADVLFGIDNANEDAEVQRLIDDTEREIYGRPLTPRDDYDIQAFAAEIDAGTREHYERLRAALARYPSNRKLLRECILRGVGLSDDDPELLAEIERMARLLTEHGADAETTREVSGLLFNMYLTTRNFAKAREYAETLPEYLTSRGLMLSRLMLSEQGDPDEQSRQNARNIHQLMGGLQAELMGLSTAYSRRGQNEDAIAVLRAFFDISEIVYGGNEYPMINGNCVIIASHYLQLGDKASALDWLEKMADLCAAHAKWNGNVVRFASPVMRYIELDMTPYTDGAKASMQLELVRLPHIIEALRNEPRFIALLDRVNAWE
ncbi:MAG: helix-turn-helix domain-containing protein [Oscillospiraceae bacterium]|jgi:transcriptional regulator with XRE-family HTH domain|nr:helix-turn-helix domain-containing protein [Oscillospiraceae bacterium]